MVFPGHHCDCIFFLLWCRWSLIAGKLPGRTDNEIKNYWNTHIKKKLLEKGMDPYTHCPIATSASNSSSSNDNTPCHVNKQPIDRHVAAETFTDFFQQQAPSSSMVSNYFTSVLDDDGDNVNLELSITLPSLNRAQGNGGTAASASSLTFTSCNDEIFYNGEATSSNGNFTKQESVCCHIGLHTIGGSCCCCSG